jgi:hypothetical protein
MILAPSEHEQVAYPFDREGIFYALQGYLDLLAREELPEFCELNDAFETIRKRFLDFAASLGLPAVWDDKPHNFVISGRDGGVDCRWWPIVSRYVDDAVRDVARAMSEDRDRRGALHASSDGGKDGPRFRFDLFTEAGDRYQTVRSFERRGVSRYRLLRMMNQSQPLLSMRLRVVMLVDQSAWDMTKFFKIISSELQDEVFGVCRKPTAISGAEDILRNLTSDNLIIRDARPIGPRDLH